MMYRELVQKAMPLENLTGEEWDLLNSYLGKQNDKLNPVLKKLVQNQARIEMIDNFLDYYGDKLEESVPDTIYTVKFL